MRHRKVRYRLSRDTSHRKATLKSLVQNLILNKRIQTTKSKAKAASRLIDRLIGFGKESDVASRRRANSILCDRGLVSILFNEIIPLFHNRNGGYTRIVHLQKRHGDNAQLVILEFVEKPKPPVKEKKRAKAVPSEAEPKKETAEKEIRELEKLPPEAPPVTKKESKIKEVPKPTPGRLKKAFTEGLRKFFRRRGEKG